MHDPQALHTLLAREDPLNWVITGDSITHGLRHTNGARSYSEHLHEIIRGELTRPRDVLVNTAISGHRITDILADFDRRVSQWAPDLVLVMIGTNDCAVRAGEPFVEPQDFARDVATFVSRVRGEGAIPVLLTPPPVDAANAPDRTRIGEFAQAVREVARAQHAPLVDVFEHFLRRGGERFPWPLLDDPFHPGALGHGAIALAIAQAFAIDEGSGTVRRLSGELTARWLSLGESGIGEV